MSVRPARSGTRRTASWLVWAACGLFAAALCLAPDRTLVPARKLALDLASQGLELSYQLQDRSETALPDSREPMSQEMARLELARRQLEIQTAELRRQLQELEARASAPLNVTPHPTLMKHAAIEALVLGRLGLATPERQLIINLGTSSGIRSEELVISHSDLLIDLGTDHGLSADDLLLTGQTLWGRVVQSGRWTSTVRRLTDGEFRTAVRLVRSSPQGPVFGARGILVGTGTGCHLEQVSATEPVSVGDHIYTDAAVTSPHPLYCGLVTAAELEPSDSFWTIEVQPAAEEQPDKLVVLRPELNALRLSAEPASTSPNTQPTSN